MPLDREEFYVGYLDAMPPRHARRVRTFIGLVAAAALLVSAGTVALQHDPGGAVWEDSPATLTGRFFAEPYPAIFIDPERPGDAARRVLLVGVGKCGAFEPEGTCGLIGPSRPDAAARAAARRSAMAMFEGQVVRATGTMLRRDGRLMLELSEGQRAVVAAPEVAQAPLHLAPPAPPAGPISARLTGEVVDAKCYLGAMKPGYGKVHRACAVRCISGGIPPVLIAAEPDGSVSYYLLADELGLAATAEVLPFVGDTVEVAGTIASGGDLPVLRMQRATITRR